LVTDGVSDTDPSLDMRLIDRYWVFTLLACFGVSTPVSKVLLGGIDLNNLAVLTGWWGIKPLCRCSHSNIKRG
jgi:hypothetical protein